MNLKASIPNPCSENWDKMKLGIHSRFCDSCQKNVMDFTKKTRQEILEYLLENQTNKVCGRIAPSQLDFSHSDILITIRSLAERHKDSNLAFYLLAMSAFILSSCNDIEYKNEKITQIELTDKQSNRIHQETPVDSTEQCETKKIKEDYIMTGEIFAIEMIEPIHPAPKIEHHLTGMMVTEYYPESYPERMPEFVGGIDDMMQFIEKKLRYPRWERKNKIEGTVYVEFVIDEKGKVKNPVIIESVAGSKNFDKEVIRMIKKMPSWIPGSNNGKVTSTTFRLPIKFQL